MASYDNKHSRNNSKRFTTQNVSVHLTIIFKSHPSIVKFQECPTTASKSLMWIIYTPWFESIQYPIWPRLYGRNLRRRITQDIKKVRERFVLPSLCGTPNRFSACEWDIVRLFITLAVSCLMEIHFASLRHVEPLANLVTGIVLTIGFETVLA
jgi:hypothetical protein